MISLSRITNTAKTVAADILQVSNSPLLNATDMFVRGARWYVSQLWHTPSEKPSHFHHDLVTLLLLRSNQEDSTIRTYTRSEIHRIFLTKTFRKADPSIIAWAYLEEINPNVTIYYDYERTKRRRNK